MQIKYLRIRKGELKLEHIELKETNQMEWVSMINNIKNRAEETN